MKLLYITNARIPTQKAHGEQIVRVISAFLETGAEVELILPKRKNAITASLSEHYGVAPFPVSYLGSPLDFLDGVLPFIYFPLMRLSFCIRSIIYCSRNEGFIFTRDLGLALALNFFFKQRVVYEDHEPKKSLLPLYYFALRRIWRKVVVPYNLMAEYERHGVEKGSYLWASNALDPRAMDAAPLDRNIWQSEHQIPAGRPIVFYAGEFYRWKGVDTLVEAGNLLGDAVYVVLIGGTGEGLARLRGMASPNTYVLDRVSLPKKLSLEKSADILILPNTALEERSARFTTPLKLFEYMYSGVPIVASNIPSLTPFLQNGVNALLASPDKAESFATAIKKIIVDPGLRQKLATQAKLDVANNTWQNRARRIVEFLESKP